MNRSDIMPEKLKVDDIWGDEDDVDHEIPHSNAEELDREWRARREEFWNSGYREGLEAGKHDTVQEGFDEGEICVFSHHRLLSLPSSVYRAVFLSFGDLFSLYFCLTTF